MNILWLSQHSPLPMHKEELEKMFNKTISLKHDKRTLDSPKDIKKRYIEGKFDDIVVEASLLVVQELCEEGMKPLWKEVEVERHDSQNVYHKFKQFRRISEVDIKYSKQQIW